MVLHLALANRVSVGGNKSQLENQYHSPPRITSNVKQSLKLLSLIKEWKESSVRVDRPTTSYRKKKVDKKSIPDPEEFESYQDPATQLIETAEGFTIVHPVLIVDGYNMCGYWPKLRKHFLRGDLMVAREMLIDEVVNYSAAKAIKAVVVFDAKDSGMPTRRETKQNVDILYAADYSADIWIEREVALLKNDGCPKIRVVSSDSLHQQIANSCGAYVWGCKLLVREINDVKKELQDIMDSNMPYSKQGKLLEHNLAPETLTSLQALKKQLKQQQVHRAKKT